MFFFSFFAFGKETQNLCGWWDNPTPGNVFFTDRKREWVISQQGDAENCLEDWGDEGARSIGKNMNEIEIIHASYGRSCVCLKVEIEAKKGVQKIKKILSNKRQTLQTCYGDKNLLNYREPKKGSDVYQQFFGVWKATNEDCLKGSKTTIRDQFMIQESVFNSDYKFIKKEKEAFWFELLTPEDKMKFVLMKVKSKTSIIFQTSSKISDEADGVLCHLSQIAR